MGVPGIVLTRPCHSALNLAAYILDETDYYTSVRTRVLEHEYNNTF